MKKEYYAHSKEGKRVPRTRGDEPEMILSIVWERRSPRGSVD